MTPPTGLGSAAELRQLITQAILDAAAANPASDEAQHTAETLAWRITATIHQHQAENASLRYDLAIQQDQHLKHIDHQQQRINRLRTLLARERRTIRAITTLHEPNARHCLECAGPDGEPAPHPCTTIRTIQDHARRND